MSRAAAVAALGLGLLAPGPAASAQTVQGEILDRAVNAPVRTGVVRLLDASGEVTNTRVDVNGRFALVAPEPGRYWLRFEAPGYRVVLSSAVQLAAGMTVAYSLHTRALPATVLDTVMVEGRAVPFRIAPFYERRARNAGGEFFLREDFERWSPVEVSDVIRRSLGFSIVPNPRYGVGGDLRQHIVLNNRLGTRLGESCRALVFVDGAYVGDTGVYDVDTQLSVDAIEAVETYAGAANIPIEFNRSGSDCGVIALWSRVTTDVASSMWRHIDFGPQLGLRFGDSGPRDARVGGRLAIGVGPVELEGALNVLVAILGSATLEDRSGWQAAASLRVRPLGRRTPWYLGTGVTVLDLNPPTRDGSFAQSIQEEYYLISSGITLPWGGRTRPFVELQLLAPFTRERREIHAYTGLSMRVY